MGPQGPITKNTIFFIVKANFIEMSKFFKIQTLTVELYHTEV